MTPEDEEFERLAKEAELRRQYEEMRQKLREEYDAGLDSPPE